MNTPLVIAAHGTRLPEGQAACRALVARVASMLPGVEVVGAYVELDSPTIADAVAGALGGSAEGRVAVVPLMLGAGGHVLEDIPDAVAEGVAEVPGGRATRSRHLGPDPRLRSAVRQRIAAASGEWAAAETTVVFLGRGCSVADANADHVRLGRMLFEEGGYREVLPAFIQVTRPSLIGALDAAYATGTRRIVVSPNFLFPGRLQVWMEREVTAWAAAHPDVEARVADVIGDCDELAGVVVDRYREADALGGGPGAPVYLAGLDLAGRRVLVAGAGRVASRRLPVLLGVGAEVHVVAPEASDLVKELAGQGRIVWSRRRVTAEDAADAWYVLAVTDDPDANALLVEVATQRHTFCVRADDAASGTARTPASASVGDLTVAVIGDRTPRRSAKARDDAVRAIAELGQS